MHHICWISTLWVCIQLMIFSFHKTRVFFSPDIVFDLSLFFQFSSIHLSLDLVSTLQPSILIPPVPYFNTLSILDTLKWFPCHHDRFVCILYTFPNPHIQSYLLFFIVSIKSKVLPVVIMHQHRHLK